MLDRRFSKRAIQLEAAPYKQALVLACMLARGGPISACELAGTLLLARTTTHRGLQLLMCSGYVIRAGFSGRGNRAYLYGLTPLGYETAQELHPSVLNTDALPPRPEPVTHQSAILECLKGYSAANPAHFEDIRAHIKLRRTSLGSALAVLVDRGVVAKLAIKRQAGQGRPANYFHLATPVE